MNEVLAPLWWVIANDPDGVSDRVAAEADTFFCFMFLMSEVRDLFIKSQDSCSTGVYGLLARYGDILARREPLIVAHHSALKIEPTYYAFRWVTTLLSREFELPDVLMIWDCLFADRYRFLFLLQLCVAMLRCQRAKLLAADFGRTLKILQNYPTIDPRVLIDTAYDVREEERRDGIDSRPTTESPAPKHRVVASAVPAASAGGTGVRDATVPGGRFSSVSSALTSAAGVAGTAAWSFISSLRSAPVSASEATTKSDADNSASEGQVMATLKPSGSASTSSSDGR